MSDPLNYSELSEKIDASIAPLDAPPTLGHVASSTSWNHDLVTFLSTSILIFTFGALLIGAILLWRHRSQSSQILHVLGVITILGVSAFLLVVGYSNEQLTPIIGLFGAIAGYLLGKDSDKSECKSEELSALRQELETLKKECGVRQVDS